MEYSGVWILAEQSRGRVQRISHELLTRGRELADKRGCDLWAMIFGASIDPDDLQELIDRGADHVVATEAPELGTPSPETVGGTTVRISLHVDDPDATAARAVAAGATEMFPVADQPYGMRQGRVVDPFGHHWLIGKRL